MTAQMDMFDFGAEREPAGPVVFTADPAKVRRKLEAVLGEARAAHTMPWDRKTELYHRTTFPQMTRWLPESEAEDMRRAFARELSRLENAG